MSKIPGMTRQQYLHVRHAKRLRRKLRQANVFLKAKRAK